MDFSYDGRTQEWRERLLAFMAEHVFPAEPVFAEQAAAAARSGFPWQRPPVVAELKAEARKRGLWNLFLAGHPEGSGLTNLQYAPLATRDATYWIGTAGNPVPRYVAYDADNSGYAHPPANVPGFINQLYPGVTYHTIYRADGVYLFRRTANGA